MLRSKKIWIVAVVALVLLNASTLTFFWWQHHLRQQRAGGSAKEYIIRELNLTAAQQLVYDSLRQVHQTALRRINEEDRSLHDRFFTRISVANIDSASLDSIALELSKMEAQKLKVALYHFHELRQILSPAQQLKFDSILSEVLKLLKRPAPHRPRHGDGPPPQGQEPEGPPPGEDGPPPPPDDK